MQFKNVIEQLTEDEQFEVDINGIETFYDLIPLLLNRISKNDLKNISSVLSQSLQPSISINLDDDLRKFSIKIGDSPELLLENDIQEEIKKFIEKRISLDKNELNKKAKEIAQVITAMTKFLAEAIDTNTKGTSNISEIAKDIESLDTTNLEQLSLMQAKLVNAAKSIETAMMKNTSSLKNGQNKVQILEEKINKLEKELEASKKESEFDHLTGVLTRRAYDRYAQKIDDNYNRNNIDYAIVFFDIDHFKKVNDTYGHDAGDKVLVELAKTMVNCVRESDFVVRFGGEEFIIILQNVKDELGILKVAEKIREVFADTKINVNGKTLIKTVSIGVAVFPKDTDKNG